MEKDQELKIAEDKYKILMYILSKIQLPIHYILGDMFPPSYGSNLFQNSSLNRTPGDNCCRVGYRGPNGIPKDVLERAQNLISVFQISDLEDEPVTRGMMYNFIVLNSPVIGHPGKMIINPNW